jgi:1,4-alpha-glucan branching enzyme
MNKQNSIKIPPEWTKNLSIYEVNLRQYSPNGTFKEFEEHLPRLKDLGVGILWFMPIQPIGEKNKKGSLGSYYSIKDYKAVNPTHGTIDEFKQLVKKIHEMGMYVILDWVANHTAWDNNLTLEHPDFFTKDEKDNFTPPNSDWSDVIHLNYNNSKLRKYLSDTMKYWIEETDIDGFRCDMAHLLPTDVWNEVRSELDKMERKKPIFMLAESENRDLIEKAFHSLYNWNIFHILNGIAKGNKCVHDIDAVLQREITDYPKHAYQMFFTSNHDENAWQGSAIERLGVGLEAYNVLTFTISGIPLIYSGQEAGEHRRLKFFEKDQIIWREDKLRPFYSTLNNLKQRNKALWNGVYGGDFSRINTSNNWGILSYIRKKDENAVFVILNLSPYDQNITLYGYDYCGEYKDVFKGEKVAFKENTDFFLRPWEYKVFEQ